MTSPAHSPTAAAPKAPLGTVRAAVGWMFRNRRTGRLTVVQWPNVSLGLYIAFSLALKVFHPAGTVDTTLRDLTDAALIVWALDEMARGVNPFRRLLGTVILILTVAGL